MFGCSTEQQQIVPYVIVQIDINLDWPQFNALNSVNNAIIYPSAGYNRNGVIVYRNSIDEFTAYDATCTQHIETKTAVVLNNNGSGGQATCPQCKMVYYLSGYGSSKGFPLQRYNVTKSNNYLFIYN
jgi:hypothetical protein